MVTTQDHLQQEDTYYKAIGNDQIGETDICSPPKGINDLENQTMMYKDYLESIAEGTREPPRIYERKERPPLKGCLQSNIRKDMKVELWQ